MLGVKREQELWDCAAECAMQSFQCNRLATGSWQLMGCTAVRAGPDGCQLPVLLVKSIM